MTRSLDSLKEEVILLHEELTKARAMAAQPPVAWEYRWLDTNPYTVTSGQWSPWERVLPQNPIYGVEERVRDIQQYINQGHKYELRALYAGPVISTPKEIL